MSYFIFNGIDSRNFGVLHGLPLPPLPERTLQTTEIPGRLQLLNRLKNERQNIQLSFVLGITSPDKIREINAWLQGCGDLILSSDLTKKYNAYVSLEITPERLTRRFGNIPITFTCEPFAYAVSNPFVSTAMGMDDNNLTGTMSIDVDGTLSSEPLLYFSLAGKLRVTVNGSDNPLIITTKGTHTDTYIADDDTDVMRYYYDYIVQNIYVEVSSLIAYTGTSTKTVITNQTVGKFPLFQIGENTILFELVPEEWEENGRKYVSHGQKLQYFGYRKNERWY